MRLSKVTFLKTLSFGSYLGAYGKKYGIDLSASSEEVEKRINEGIQNKWEPDASGAYGAVRWYHREEFGANPKTCGTVLPNHSEVLRLPKCKFPLVRRNSFSNARKVSM